MDEEQGGKNDPRQIPLVAKPGWREISLPFAHLIRSFVSADCCGSRLRVRYFESDRDNALHGKVWFGPAAEGPPGCAHGGAQAAVLDEICGGAAWMAGYPVVAASLRVNFVEMTPLGCELELKARVVSVSGRRVSVSGELRGGGGCLYASADGLYVELSPERQGEMWRKFAAGCPSMKRKQP